MKHKKQPQAKQAAHKKRGRKPKPYGEGVRDFPKNLIRFRPDIDAAMRADSGSINSIVNNALAMKYGLPPYP